MKAFLLLTLFVGLNLGISAQSVVAVTTATADTLTTTSDTTSYVIPLERGYQSLSMEVSLTPRVSTVAAGPGFTIYYYVYKSNNGFNYKLYQEVDSVKTTDSTSQAVIQLQITNPGFAYYKLQLVNRTTNGKIFPRFWYYPKAFYTKPN